ncbi:hypothetical protein ACP4OV_019267 [Aristida adscensionis]
MADGGRRRAMPQPPAAGAGGPDLWEYSLRKYLLLLATLVATVTYTAAFNPPGGVWQDTAGPGRLAGDPVLRDTDYGRYLVFYYSNATAFASSLVVIVLILVLAVLHDRGSNGLRPPLRTLRVVMVLDLLSLMAAYAAGTCRDTLTSAYSAALVAAVAAYLAFHVARPPPDGEEKDKPLRKALMLLATFAVSVTYLAGLSAPGGFWDHDEGRRRAGDAVLKGGRHDARLKVFFLCNTTAFVASLLIVVLLLGKTLRQSLHMLPFGELHCFILVALVALVAAYSAGSCRQIDTTIYVNALVGAVLSCVLLQVVLVRYCKQAIQRTRFWEYLKSKYDSVSTLFQKVSTYFREQASDGNGSEALEKARSLVLLLATLAATITYQAGLSPPGGLWQADGGGYKAGDPILKTINRRRYRAFYYCNSVAFVASLVAIVLVQKSVLLRHHALEAAMILDLFGLIGAYAAGSCRDVSTSVYAIAISGAVLVYVVIHIVFTTLDHDAAGNGGGGSGEELMEKMRKRLLLFAILVATMTYQAGLTPPGGLLVEDKAGGHRAGDPVLLYNYPRRYKAFFYCNTVSFMLSIALIVLLVNRNLYRPAIRSNALSVCTAAGMCSLMGAYAAGSTQHLKTSFYIFALVALVLGCVAYLVWSSKEDQPHNTNNNIIMNNNSNNDNNDYDNDDSTAVDADVEGNGNVNAGADVEDNGRPSEAEMKWRAKRKYLMVLGILVASVTYQAGLTPPGAFWQGDGGRHVAGDPVMHDNRRGRYLAFFYSNSTSFVASVVVIALLLPEKLHDRRWWLGVMNTTIVLDLLGLLVAYAAGSSRSFRASLIVSGLVLAVLLYFLIHVALSLYSRSRGSGTPAPADPATGANQVANGRDSESV